jgi:hypothetical protein
MNVGFLFKHFWVAFIAVTCANGVIWWFRARKDFAQIPNGKRDIAG